MKKLFLILFFSFILFESFETVCQAQTLTLTFTWTNTNPGIVTYDIAEVKAPPDTNTFLFYVNSSLITATTYIYRTPADDKTHYYRIRAYVTNDFYSPFSSTVSAYLKKGLLAPINFKVVIE